MTDTFFSEMSETDLFLQQDNSDDAFPERKNVFSALQSYVLSCKWQNTPRTHDLMQSIRFSSVDAARYMEISPNTVRSARSAASNRLYSLFGKDVFKIIKSGSLVNLRELYDWVYSLSCDYDNVECFIPISLIDEITASPRKSVRQYSVEELSSELAFIRDYDLIKMKRRLRELDLDKLHYILDALRETAVDYRQADCINTKRFELLRNIIHV